MTDLPAVKDNSDAVRWLRVAYWVGAITDLGAALQMLSPTLFGFAYGLPHFSPGSDYRYAMGMGASLMIGWTGLLLWADRRPLDRRGVLPLTVFPVIFGLMLNEIVGISGGFMPLLPLLPVFVLQAVLAALFLVAYRKGEAAAAAT
jgi:hypothetical protein